jgi:hypothetical protein
MRLQRIFLAMVDAVLAAVGDAAQVWSYSAAGGRGAWPGPAPRASTRPSIRRHGRRHPWVNVNVLRRASGFSNVEASRTDPGPARPRCRIRPTESRHPQGRAGGGAARPA